MKKVFCIIGLVVGAHMMIFGFIVMGLEDGSTYLYSTTFGADFYTYSYRATRVAAENVGYLTIIVQKGLSFLLIGLGAMDICMFGCKLGEGKKAKAAAPAAAVTETVKEAEEVPATAEETAAPAEEETAKTEE